MRKAKQFPYEGSATDVRQDKRQAARRGMPTEEFEGSPADIAMDQVGQRRLNKKTMKVGTKSKRRG